MFNLLVIARNHSERLEELYGLFELGATLEQIASFLSSSCDPSGERCGVSVLRLDSYGLIRAEILIGFRIALDQGQTLTISDDNPACVALRTGKSHFADLTDVGDEYSEIPQLDRLTQYKTGLALPLSKSMVLGLAFPSAIEVVRAHQGYFEVVRLALGRYVDRETDPSMRLHQRNLHDEGELTARQSKILEMIKEGRTNGSIAAHLGYSESLIRQETVIIYRKLGISGRDQLDINR